MTVLDYLLTSAIVVLCAHAARLIVRLEVNAALDARAAAIAKWMREHDEA
jgi:hypothetical protein